MLPFVCTFTTPVFTGGTWNEVPPSLRQVTHKKPKKKHPQPTGTPSSNPNPNPNPFPTYSCDPSVVTCGAPGGNQMSVNATVVGGAVGGIFTGLPATCLWVRRRTRKRGPKRG